MAAPPHIVFLSPGFASDEQDGYCMPYFQHFLHRLHQRQPDWRLEVVALHYPYHREPYQWHGIPVYPCGGNNRNFPWRFWMWRRALRQLRALHREHPVSAVHSFWMAEAAFLGNRFCKREQLPHLVTLMGQDALPANRYLQRLDLDYPTVLAVSDRQAEAYQATTGRKPLEVIPHGHDFQWEELQMEEARPIDILGVGAMVPVKNYRAFVEAIAAIKEQKPDVKVVLIGHGPEQERLEALSRNLGLENTLEFKGFCTRDVVLETMGRSRVLLHPANYEGFGFVFSEALYQGMHVVSKAVGSATAGPKWSVVEADQQLAGAVIEVLDQPLDTQRTSIWEVDQTVDAYLRHYPGLS